MKPGTWILIAAIFGFLGVALGAFGAHALQDRFGDYEKGVWQTATHYHLIHSVVLLGFGIAMASIPNVEVEISSTFSSIIGWCFTLGILVFSGSLYALALSGVRALGAITPLGGLSFMAGWICLARFGYLLTNR